MSSRTALFTNWKFGQTGTNINTTSGLTWRSTPAKQNQHQLALSWTRHSIVWRELDFLCVRQLFIIAIMMDLITMCARWKNISGLGWLRYWQKNATMPRSSHPFWNKVSRDTLWKGIFYQEKVVTDCSIFTFVCWFSLSHSSFCIKM